MSIASDIFGLLAVNALAFFSYAAGRHSGYRAGFQYAVEHCAYEASAHGEERDRS